MTDVLFYQELDGRCPVLEFLSEQPPLVRAHALDRVKLLEEHGHNLRRPHADFLEEGIYELRWRVGRVQHRILYAFHGEGVAVLLHALTKEGKIPNADLTRAVTRQARFEANPRRHTKS